MIGFHQIWNVKGKFVNIEDMINEIKEYVDQFNPTGEEEATDVVRKLVNLHDNLSRIRIPVENKLSEIGVKYQIPIYIGYEYVDGRYLVLDYDEYNGYEAGEWVSSSETC